MKKITVNIPAEDLKKKVAPTKSELEAIITPLIPPAIPGKDGESPTIDTEDIVTRASKLAVDEIKPQIPTIDSVVDNIPVIGEKVRDSLELLEGDERLSIEAIKDLEEELNKRDNKVEQHIVSTSNRSLGALLDVDASGVQNNYGLFWDSASSQWKAKEPSDADSEFDYIQFNTSATPLPNAEGLLQWNATDGTLDLGMSGGDVTMQIGQELFTKVRNEAGYETISNGQVVYISGRTGVFPEVRKARSDSELTSRVLGVTTQDIASPDFGFVTTAGYVRGIKTNYTGTGDWGTTWSAGDLLYVSKTVAGQLTNVEPTAPHHSDIVGTVGVISATQGSILITLDRHRTLEELTDVDGTALTVDGQFPSWHNTEGYFDFDKNINNYVPYTGATTDVDLGAYSLTATRLALSGTSGTLIDFSGDNATTDVTMWRVGADIGYGFYAKYMGSGSGVNNAYQFWTEGQGATDLLVYSVNQDGDMDFSDNSLTTTGAIASGPITAIRTNDSGTILALGNSPTTLYEFKRSAVTGALSVQGTQAGFSNIALAPTDGNVGVGIAAPTSKFHVLGESNLDGEVKVGATSGKIVMGEISGNTRGTNAVDIQSIRSAATQVASGLNSLALGGLNTASGNVSAAIGYSNTSSSSNSFTFGQANTASATQAVAFGYTNTASTINSSAIGSNNSATTQQGTSAIGSGNIASNYFSSAIGYGNTASGYYSTAVGFTNQATNIYTSSIGYMNTVSGSYSSASGYYNQVAGNQATAVGYQNIVGGTSGNVGIGFGNTVSGGQGAMGLGFSNTASANYSTAIGATVTNSTASSVELGPSNTSKLHMGANKDVYMGQGITVASPSTASYNATGGSGTNNAGADVILASGKGTGNAAGGDILFQTSTAGASGTTLQTLATRMTVDVNGDTFWTGSSTGLPYGNLYVKDNVTAVSLDSTGGKVQITNFANAGASNLTTPSAANDEILITKAGVYKIDVAITVSNGAGASHVLDATLYKNNGATEIVGLHANRTLGAGTDIGSIVLSGLHTFAANDTLELWANTSRATATSVTFSDMSMTVVQVGG